MMLEVINGFLLIYFVILCTISTLVPHLVKPIVTCFIRPSNEERTMWAEIQKLKSAQKTISMKEEFAAYSKIQRKINKIESELKDNSQSRMSKSLAIKSSVQIVFQVVVALIMILSVIWFRQEPIVALKGDLFPLTTMLRYPSSMPNAISTHMWVIISNFSIRTLLKPVLS
ncbi:guided entry of tail-anchored proteins factor 1-like [Galleria mellonella]|uniref:Guided entry of tail-anchored proteins factor 1 n=1 Tax=Galleria mellonella TaxID=7137 RepID=A0A6J1WN56_GALME|nr:guided entry of tail-anchored proteins factor 1-like [Galleria mellonella]